MERIEPIGPWPGALQPVSRPQPPGKVGEEGKRRQADEEPRERRDADDGGEDDGADHVDVTA
jgi:hypothetical protein